MYMVGTHTHTLRTRAHARVRTHTDTHAHSTLLLQDAKLTTSTLPRGNPPAADAWEKLYAHGRLQLETLTVVCGPFVINGYRVSERKYCQNGAIKF